MQADDNKRRARGMDFWIASVVYPTSEFNLNKLRFVSCYILSYLCNPTIIAMDKTREWQQWLTSSAPGQSSEVAVPINPCDDPAFKYWGPLVDDDDDEIFDIPMFFRLIVCMCRNSVLCTF
jgi:hypothetical protein